MRRTQRARGSGKLGCIIWLAILGLIGYGLYKIIPVKIAISTFYDFMEEEASFASIRSTQTLQKEILAKARDLDLPVGEENLIIKRTKESVTIEAHYQITVDFFGGPSSKFPLPSQWKRYVWKVDDVTRPRPIFLV